MIRPPLVLAYHGLGRLPRSWDPHNLMVPAEELEQQIRRLLRRRYEFVQLSDFARKLSAGQSLRGVCALTFDDGSADNASLLPGLLARLSIPATVFVCPGLLGEPHPFIAPEAGIRLMTREELVGIAALPLVEIGSHTTFHTDLSAATEEEAYTEMARSKAALEELLGIPVVTFAYPGCAYSSACPEAARRAGYVAAVTCGPRGGRRPYELRRESVDPLDGQISFALKSRGLFWGPWATPVGSLARRLTRSRRHGSAS